MSIKSVRVQGSSLLGDIAIGPKIQYSLGRCPFRKTAAMTIMFKFPHGPIKYNIVYSLGSCVPDLMC